MQYKAKLSNLHISPRKVRLVANLVRGENVIVAQKQLQFLPKRASYSILKLLNSAVSNAKNINSDLNEEKLFVKIIFVDEGPKFKRFRPVARGSAHEIQKKTSNITLILAEQELKNSQALSAKIKKNFKLQTKSKNLNPRKLIKLRAKS